MEERCYRLRLFLYAQGRYVRGRRVGLLKLKNLLLVRGCRCYGIGLLQDLRDLCRRGSIGVGFEF